MDQKTKTLSDAIKRDRFVNHLCSIKRELVGVNVFEKQEVFISKRDRFINDMNATREALKNVNIFE